MGEPLVTVIKPAPEDAGEGLTGSAGAGGNRLPNLTGGSLNIPVQDPDGGGWLWGGGNNGDSLKSWLLILGIFAIGLLVVSAGRKK